MKIYWNNELYHYGMPRRSGRYPWGSGANPYHHGKSLLGRAADKIRQYTSSSPTLNRSRARGEMFDRASKTASSVHNRLRRSSTLNDDRRYDDILSDIDRGRALFRSNASTFQNIIMSSIRSRHSSDALDVISSFQSTPIPPSRTYAVKRPAPVPRNSLSTNVVRRPLTKQSPYEKTRESYKTAWSRDGKPWEKHAKSGAELMGVRTPKSYLDYYTGQSVRNRYYNDYNPNPQKRTAWSGSGSRYHGTVKRRRLR